MLFGVGSLSRRQQGFKSPWGRQLINTAVRISDGLFYCVLVWPVNRKFIMSTSKVPHRMRVSHTVAGLGMPTTKASITLRYSDCV